MKPPDRSVPKAVDWSPAKNWRELAAKELARLSLLRTQMLDVHAFWGAMLLPMKLIPATLGSPMATDCVDRIWFDPECTRYLPLRQLGYVLLHEVFHVAFETLHRKGARQAHLWNIAMDLAINRNIERLCGTDTHWSGFRIYETPGVLLENEIRFQPLLDPSCDSLPAEAIYEKLLGDDELPEPVPRELQLPTDSEGVEESRKEKASAGGGCDEEKRESRKEKASAGGGGRDEEKQEGEKSSGSPADGGDSRADAAGEDGDGDGQTKDAASLKRRKSARSPARSAGLTASGAGRKGAADSMGSKSPDSQGAADSMGSKSPDSQGAADSMGSDSPDSQGAADSMGSKSPDSQGAQASAGLSVWHVKTADHGGGIDIHLPPVSRDERVRERILERMVDCYQHWEESRQRGEIPGDIERLIQQTRGFKVNWRRLFHQFADPCLGREEFSLSRPHRRYLEMEFVLPGIVDERLGTLVVAVDTSGSMSGSFLNMVFSELETLADLADECLIISCDAKIHDVVKTNHLQEFIKKQRWHGGGGTSHLPVFEYIRKHHIHPSLLVGISDLYSDFPEKAPPYPVLWVVPETACRGRKLRDVVSFGAFLPVADSE